MVGAEEHAGEGGDVHTRWSFHFFGVVEIVAMGLSAFGRVDARLATVLFLMVGVHATVLMLVASRTLDWELGLRAKPARLLWTLAVLTVVIAFASLGVAKGGSYGGDVAAAAGAAFGGVVTIGSGIIALGLRSRRHAIAPRPRFLGRRRDALAPAGRAGPRRPLHRGRRAGGRRLRRLRLCLLRMAAQRRPRTGPGAGDPDPARRRRGTAAVRAGPARRDGPEPGGDRAQERTGRPAVPARPARRRWSR
ncbi:hypothetical protein LV779_38660 [Streptomyces thinghirensis]|nr:hypothetical protein [Streptomyces thinghirensis]